VNRIEKLCSLDRELLQRFSSTCLGSLREQLLFELALPLLRDFLELNVEKEVAKDRMIIQLAGEAFSSGKVIGEEKIQKIFERTKVIDAEYIHKARSGDFSFLLQYEDIRDIRKERIRLIVDTVTGLLSIWHEKSSFEEIVRCLFPREQYRERIFTFLHLYDMETRMLGDSIRIALPARMAKDILVNKLYEIMEQVSNRIARSCVEKVYDS